MERSGERLRIPLDVFVMLLTNGINGLLLQLRVSGDEAEAKAALDLFRDLMLTLVEPPVEQSV